MVERFEFVADLGEGAYGTVWKALDKETGRMVAMKRFKEAHLDEEVMRLAIREIRLLKASSHPNVVALYEAFKSKSGRVYMVMELVDHSLTEEVRRQPLGFAPDRLKVLTWQLLQATAFLHSNNIIHRDLKPANILVTKDGTIKLCDFGFARTSASSSEAAAFTQYVVTRWYRPPEVLVGGPYGCAVDVWAIGCLFSEMATGLPLFPGRDTLDQLWLTMRTLGPLPKSQMQMLSSDASLAGVKIPSPSELRPLSKRFPDFSPAMMDVLTACLHPDPALRLTAQEVLALEYFDDVHEHMAGTGLQAAYDEAYAAAAAAATAAGSGGSTGIGSAAALSLSLWPCTSMCARERAGAAAAGPGGGDALTEAVVDTHSQQSQQQQQQQSHQQQQQQQPLHPHEPSNPPAHAQYPHHHGNGGGGGAVSRHHRQSSGVSDGPQSCGSLEVALSRSTSGGAALQQNVPAAAAAAGAADADAHVHASVADRRQSETSKRLQQQQQQQQQQQAAQPPRTRTTAQRRQTMDNGLLSPCVYQGAVSAEPSGRSLTGPPAFDATFTRMSVGAVSQHGNGGGSGNSSGSGSATLAITNSGYFKRASEGAAKDNGGGAASGGAQGHGGHSVSMRQRASEGQVAISAAGASSNGRVPKMQQHSISFGRPVGNGSGGAAAAKPQHLAPLAAREHSTPRSPGPNFQVVSGGVADAAAAAKQHAAALRASFSMHATSGKQAAAAGGQGPPRGSHEERRRSLVSFSTGDGGALALATSREASDCGTIPSHRGGGGGGGDADGGQQQQHGMLHPSEQHLAMATAKAGAGQVSLPVIAHLQHQMTVKAKPPGSGVLQRSARSRSNSHLEMTQI